MTELTKFMSSIVFRWSCYSQTATCPSCLHMHSTVDLNQGVVCFCGVLRIW